MLIDPSDDPHADQPATPPPFDEGAPGWVVTFGDMMSLLLTFFILMFSMSELKMDRFLLASQSLRQAMGGTASEEIEDPMGLMPDRVDPELTLLHAGAAESAGPAPGGLGGAAVLTPGGEDPEVTAFTDAYLAMLAERLKEFVRERGLERDISVEALPDGVWLRLGTMVLFGSGDAELQVRGRSLLPDLAAITRGLEVGMTVSGHADDRPIHSAAFASNWELSAARAAGVARTLVEAGQDAQRVRVESYGEHRPVRSNDTEEGRAQNRRVDLFFARADVVTVAERLLATPDQLPPDEVVPTSP